MLPVEGAVSARAGFAAADCADPEKAGVQAERAGAPCTVDTGAISGNTEASAALPAPTCARAAVQPRGHMRGQAGLRKPQCPR